MSRVGHRPQDARRLRDRERVVEAHNRFDASGWRPPRPKAGRRRRTNAPAKHAAEMKSKFADLDPNWAPSGVKRLASAHEVG
jgi:hypothetical protein